MRKYCQTSFNPQSYMYPKKENLEKNQPIPSVSVYTLESSFTVCSQIGLVKFTD